MVQESGTSARKALIIVKSVHHGNTRKVAEAMAGILGAKVASPEEARAEGLDGYQMIGLGSGIYGGRHHKEVLELAGSLDAGEMGGKRFFIFSTSGAGEKAMEKHHRRLKDMLRERGLEIAGEFSCRGLVTWGPFRLVGGMSKGHPDGEDLERARGFARGLKDRVAPGADGGA
jgi:flavodoxin